MCGLKISDLVIHRVPDRVHRFIPHIFMDHVQCIRHDPGARMCLGLTDEVPAFVGLMLGWGRQIIT